MELIHTDVCNIIIKSVSHNGNNYVETLVNEHSRYVIIYAIIHKDNVLKYFKVYEAKATSMFCKRRVAKMKCDNGGEYCPKLLVDFCTEKGIHMLLHILHNSIVLQRGLIRI